MASGKILIVDDDTNICELLRLYIEKEGFEASIANDGETALKMFDTVNPDISVPFREYHTPIPSMKMAYTPMTAQMVNSLLTVSTPLVILHFKANML